MALKDSSSYEIILYDTQLCNCIIEYLNILYGINKYAYCLHNKDVKYESQKVYYNEVDIEVYTSEVIKKQHIHLLVWFGRKVSYKTIISQLFINYDIELGKNQFSNINNKRSAIRYLIHYDNVDKFQYDINSIVSNFELECFFNLSNEEIKGNLINDVNEFLTKCASDKMPWGKVISESIKKNLFNELKRGGILYKNLYDYLYMTSKCDIF